jgi:hypothetical protein
MKKKPTKVENLPKIKNLKKTCGEIFFAFDCPGGYDSVPYMSVSEFIDQIAPWEKIAEKKSSAFGKMEEGDLFGKVYNAIQVSFAVGYAFGQLLDTFEGDVELIQSAIQRKRVGLYFPHRKLAGILPLK